MEEINSYYEQLAPEYDQDRFGNSYGRYLHQQEYAALQKLLQPSAGEKLLDLACGTGRLSMLATHGLDQSAEMVRIAKAKYPDKEWKVSSAIDTGFPDHHFDKIYSFHFFMHLDRKTALLVLKELHRILRPGGQLIFDVPSTKRRKVVGYQPSSWHGAGSWSMRELRNALQSNWEYKGFQGLLSVPIHRLPTRWRSLFSPLDNLICKSPFREFSSYLLTNWRRK